MINGTNAVSQPQEIKNDDHEVAGGAAVAPGYIPAGQEFTPEIEGDSTSVSGSSSSTSSASGQTSVNSGADLSSNPVPGSNYYRDVDGVATDRFLAQFYLSWGNTAASLVNNIMTEELSNLDASMRNTARLRRGHRYIDPNNRRVQQLLRQLKAEGVITDDMSTDEIAQAVHEYIAENYEYLADQGDYWQGLNETIARGGGDCEDLAFLEASLLMAALMDSGLTYEDALGRVNVVVTGDAEGNGHMVVGYRDSNGQDRVLDASLGYSGVENSMADYETVDLNDDNSVLVVINDRESRFVDKDYDYSQLNTRGWFKNVVDGVMPGLTATIEGRNPIDYFTSTDGATFIAFGPPGSAFLKTVEGIRDIFCEGSEMSKFKRTQAMREHNERYENADLSYLEFEGDPDDPGSIDADMRNTLEDINEDDFYYYDERGFRVLDEDRLEMLYAKMRMYASFRLMRATAMASRLELVEQIIDRALDLPPEGEVGGQRISLTETESKLTQMMLEKAGMSIAAMAQNIQAYNYARYQDMLKEAKKDNDGAWENFTDKLSGGGQEEKVLDNKKKASKWYADATRKTIEALVNILYSYRYSGVNQEITDAVDETLDDFDVDEYLHQGKNDYIDVNRAKDAILDLRDKLTSILGAQRAFFVVLAAREEMSMMINEATSGVSSGASKAKLAAQLIEEEIGHLRMVFDRTADAVLSLAKIKNQINQINKAIKKIHIARPFIVMALALKAASIFFGLVAVGFIVLPPIALIAGLLSVLCMALAAVTEWAGQALADHYVDDSYEPEIPEEDEREVRSTNTGDSSLDALHEAQNGQDQIMSDVDMDLLGKDKDGYYNVDYGRVAGLQEGMHSIHQAMRIIFEIRMIQQSLLRMVLAVQGVRATGGLENYMFQDPSMLRFNARVSYYSELALGHNAEQQQKNAMKDATTNMWVTLAAAAAGAAAGGTIGAASDAAGSGASLGFSVGGALGGAYSEYHNAKHAGPGKGEFINYDEEIRQRNLNSVHARMDQARDELYQEYMNNAIKGAGDGYSCENANLAQETNLALQRLAYLRMTIATIIETQLALQSAVLASAGIVTSGSKLYTKLTIAQIKNDIQVFSTLRKAVAEEVSIKNRQRDADKRLTLATYKLVATVATLVVSAAAGAGVGWSTGLSMFGPANMLVNSIIDAWHNARAAREDYGDLKNYRPVNGDSHDRMARSRASGERAIENLDALEARVYLDMGMLEGVGGGREAINSGFLAEAQTRLNDAATARQVVVRILQTMRDIQQMVMRTMGRTQISSDNPMLQMLNFHGQFMNDLLQIQYRALQTHAMRTSQMSDAQRAMWQASARAVVALVQAYLSCRISLANRQNQELMEKLGDNELGDNEVDAANDTITANQSKIADWTWTSMGMSMYGVFNDILVGAIYDNCNEADASRREPVLHEQRVRSANAESRREEAAERRSWARTMERLEQMTLGYQIAAGDIEISNARMEVGKRTAQEFTTMMFALQDAVAEALKDYHRMIKGSILWDKQAQNLQALQTARENLGSARAEQKESAKELAAARVELEAAQKKGENVPAAMEAYVAAYNNHIEQTLAVIEATKAVLQGVDAVARSAEEINGEAQKDEGTEKKGPAREVNTQQVEELDQLVQQLRLNQSKINEHYQRLERMQQELAHDNMVNKDAVKKAKQQASELLKQLGSNEQVQQAHADLMVAINAFQQQDQTPNTARNMLMAYAEFIEQAAAASAHQSQQVVDQAADQASQQAGQVIDANSLNPIIAQALEQKVVARLEKELGMPLEEVEDVEQLKAHRVQVRAAMAQTAEEKSAANKQRARLQKALRAPGLSEEARKKLNVELERVQGEISRLGTELKAHRRYLVKVDNVLREKFKLSDAEIAALRPADLRAAPDKGSKTSKAKGASSKPGPEEDTVELSADKLPSGAKLGKMSLKQLKELYRRKLEQGASAQVLKVVEEQMVKKVSLRLEREEGLEPEKAEIKARKQVKKWIKGLQQPEQKPEKKEKREYIQDEQESAPSAVASGPVLPESPAYSIYVQCQARQANNTALKARLEHIMSRIEAATVVADTPGLTPAQKTAVQQEPSYLELIRIRNKLKPQVEACQKELGELATELTELEGRLEQLQAKGDHLTDAEKEELDRVQAKIEKIEERQKALEKKVEKLEKQLKSVEEKISKLETKVKEAVASAVEELERKRKKEKEEEQAPAIKPAGNGQRHVRNDYNDAVWAQQKIAEQNHNNSSFASVG